jgi:hypothetical protein
MKNIFKHAVKTSVIAAALALAAGAHAETYTETPVYGTFIMDGGAKVFKNEPDFPITTQGVAIYSMNSATMSDVLAFCIGPTVDLLPGTSYTATSFTSSVTDKVKALYETSYSGLSIAGSTLSADDKKVAFQLALWDAMYDDGSMYATTAGAKQYFTYQNDEIVSAAQSMLDLTVNYHVLNTYAYTAYNGTGKDVNGNDVASQALMSARMISAVPEADTWAMMALGLGLVGFMGQRQIRRPEKFA